MSKQRKLTLLFVLMFAANSYGQSRGGGADVVVTVRQLSRVERRDVRSETGGFKLPVKCDVDGNIYLRPGGSRLGPIRKIERDGKQAITVTAGSDVQWSRFGYFDVDGGGAIHQLAYISGDADPYILHFKADGTYASRTRLQPEPGLRWSVYQVASFPSGGFLVAGSAGNVADSGSAVGRALTVVVSTDGTIVKEVKLVDDEKLRGMAEKGEKGLVLPGAPEANLAIDFGSAEPAEDGNVYVMRHITPAIIYVISPGGEVLRRFTLDPLPGSDSAGLLPLSLHISRNRLAVLFDDNRGKQLIKVVSPTGELLATYETPTGPDSPGAGLACYLAEKERFVFLGRTDEGFVSFDVYTPR